MVELAEIFSDIQAHIKSQRFIQRYSTNRTDIREFAFGDQDLKDRRNVLDLGCGFGFFSRGLKGRVYPGARFTGLDLWDGYREHYLRACKDSGFEGRFLLSQTSPDSRFQAEGFDLVICSFALYFFPEIIPDIARVLTPNGKLIAITHTVPHMQELIDILKKVLPGAESRAVPLLPMEKLFRRFSNRNGLEMLAPSFQEVKISRFDNSLQIDSAAMAELIAYLHFKSLSFLPEDFMGDQMLFGRFIEKIKEIIVSEGCLRITKGDTVFTCQK